MTFCVTWFCFTEKITCGHPQVIVSNNTARHLQVNKGSTQTEINLREKLFSMKIDPKLSFEKHIEQIYAKARIKLKALARIAPFMNIQKRKVLMKAVFTA